MSELPLRRWLPWLLADAVQGAPRRRLDRAGAAQLSVGERRSRRRIALVTAILVVAVVAAVWGLVVRSRTEPGDRSGNRPVAVAR